MGEAFVMHGVGAGAPLVDSPRFGRRNTFDLAFLDEVRLKLGFG